MIEKVYIAVMYHDDGTYTGEERGPDSQRANRILDAHMQNGGDGYIDVSGTCECGDSVSLEHDENACPNCGVIYNAWGQRLRDPYNSRGYTDYEIEMGLDN